MAQSEVQPFEWKRCKTCASMKTNLSWCVDEVLQPMWDKSTANIKPEILGKFMVQRKFPQLHKCLRGDCFSHKCFPVQLVPGGWVCDQEAALWSTAELSAELGTPECPHSGDPGRKPDPPIVQSISLARSLHSSEHVGPHRDWKQRCSGTIRAD